MVAPATDPIGLESAEILAELGFDYIELSLAHLAALSPRSFADAATRLERAGLACEACNNFFPPHIRLTGRDADLGVALTYARQALARAASIGARVVVFGSSGAKNIPPGWARDQAWLQVVELLRHLGPLAASHAVVIVIEPINREESNFINRAEEGLRLATEVGHPNVQLLVDFYHLLMEGEDPEIVLRAGPAIRHLHVADVDGRRFPRTIGPATSELFDRLRRAGYEGRCSIEAFTDDVRTDAGLSLRLLRQEAARTSGPDTRRGTGAKL